MSVFSAICVSVLLGVWVVETVLFVLSYRTSGRADLLDPATTLGSQLQERHGKEAPRGGRDLGRQPGLCDVRWAMPVAKVTSGELEEDQDATTWRKDLTRRQVGRQSENSDPSAMHSGR